ncbi:hypothetical protein RUM44_013780 [Polyplax serrata]|uniref:H15 domain-containing protein n=1 Tax=Polyplax serrata TaxID=468196 RepID=A0ABR1BJ84_POLSC
MSLLFADIFEAIRHLRLCKGTTEKGILCYVEERIGGSLSTSHLDSNAKFELNNSTQEDKMFDEHFPLEEVIQAIESLQGTKGSTGKQIIEFIRNQGKEFSEEKMLKAIRALQKLVDEGVLVKNGKRYSFAKKPALPKDDDCDEEEAKDCDEGCGDEEEDDETSEEEESDDDDEEEEECNQCPKPEEDDDDDDDDEEESESEEEEEEEEEEEDDDDEECDDNDGPKNDGDNELGGTPGIVEPSGGVVHVLSNTQNPLLKGETNPNPKASEKKGITEGKHQLNPEKSKNIIPHNNAGKDDKCKFIEKTELKKADKKKKMKVGSKESGIGRAKKVKNANSDHDKNKDSKSPERKGRNKKQRSKVNKYRSVSPLKRGKCAVYSLKMDNSMELGPFSKSSQLFPETTKTDIDLTFEKNVEDTAMDYDLFRHRSPNGPPPPNTPGVHVNRKESCCSDFDKYIDDDIKMQSLYEPQFSLAVNLDSNSMNNVRGDVETRYFKDSGDCHGREKHKRDRSFDCENFSSDVAAKSLCSVCKKKRIS